MDSNNDQMLPGTPFQLTTNEANVLFARIGRVYSIGVCFMSLLATLLLLMVTISTSQILATFYKTTKRKPKDPASNKLYSMMKSDPLVTRLRKQKGVENRKNQLKKDGDKVPLIPYERETSLRKTSRQDSTEQVNFWDNAV